MIAADLLAYALVLLTAVAAALARARWPERAPRLGIAAWLALTGSAAGSVALSGIALAMTGGRVSAALARLLAICVMTLRAHYAHPGGAPLAAAGSVLALAVISRVAWCTARTLGSAWRAGRRHHDRLGIAGRPDPRLGAMVIEHRDPAAWCLPGTRRPVVITTGAISALSREQLAAVLAHERAHQRGRHHLLVALAASLAAAFPYVPAFRQGREQVARLVELLADDAATTAIPRLTVAEALLALAAPVPAPALALAAGGSATGARIRRLAAAPAPLSRPAAMAGRLAISALIAIPLLVLAGPAIAAIAANCCHHADFPAIAARQLPPTGLPAPGGTR